jgi:8-hydroxy-5-deazaflavin:NADPH oxidoreductase
VKHRDEQIIPYHLQKTKNMKIGIIGSGDVGRSLGKGFLAEGHAVMLGTRNIEKEEVVKWKEAHTGAETGSFEAAAQFGEIIVLATKGDIAADALQLAGIDSLAGKIIIDATNPIAAAPPEDGVLKFFTDYNQSLMEKLQSLVPAANFVKAFSCVGNGFMYKPAFPGGVPTMFICGNDDAAKATVTGILTSFGWETEDMGKAAAARAIEPLCILWCLPGFTRNQWTHAFKLLKM